MAQLAPIAGHLIGRHVLVGSRRARVSAAYRWLAAHSQRARLILKVNVNVAEMENANSWCTGLIGIISITFEFFI